MCPTELTQPQHNSISALTSLPLVPFRCTQFAPMKLVYNPGGFCAGRHVQKYNTGHRGHRHRYTRGEKLAILGVLDKLMVELLKIMLISSLLLFYCRDEEWYDCEARASDLPG